MPNFNEEPEGILIYSDPRWELRAYQATSKSMSVKVIQKSTWYFSTPPEGVLPKTIPEGVQDKLKAAFQNEAAHLLALHSQGQGEMPFVYHDESYREDLDGGGDEAPILCDCGTIAGAPHNISCAVVAF